MSGGRAAARCCHDRAVAIKAAPGTDSRLAARCAALASLGAAVVHFAVVPAHWQEWPLSGAFFGVLALLQLIWAQAVLIRTTAPVLAAGILLNASAILLWALSRTVGAPFGPHAGQAELVQGADLAALLLQIYVVMGAGWIWYRGLQGEPVSTLSSAAVLLTAVGVVALASTVGVVSGQRHGHQHGPSRPDSGHHSTDAQDHHAHHTQQPETAPAHPLKTAPAAPPNAGSGPAPTPRVVESPAQPLHDHSNHRH